MKKMALFILNESSRDKIYGPDELKRVNKAVDVYSPMLTYKQIKENPDILKKCNIILSGWGGPLIDNWFLDKSPELEAVFYGAGSIRGIVTPEFWEKDIKITSSWTANAIPVAEFTFAQIILCLKNTYRLNRLYTDVYPQTAKSAEPGVTYHKLHESKKAYGAYRTVVGIISLGVIGRLVCGLLKNLDVDVIAYDPIISRGEAEELGATLVSLETLFRTSHVVSLHAPWLPETEGMLKGMHFEMMKNGSSFINTARGAIVNEGEMIEVLRKRNDITAILDVTDPEPPAADSELFTMNNVFLTPHIAGSMNDECRRMGKYAVDEMLRYLNGEPLKYLVSEKQFRTMA